MPIIFKMPALSPTMEKGNLVEWIKKEGDIIEIGDVIAEIDTDKATMEVESIYKGKLAKILIPAGTHSVLVGTPIGVISQKDDSDSEIQKAIESCETVGQIDEEEPVKVSENMIVKESELGKVEPKGDVFKISPLAKRLANEFGIDIQKTVGSGPGGRIVKQDILNAKQLKNTDVDLNANSPKYIDENITNIRKVMAEKLTKSKRDTPHFYMSASANVTDLLKIRKSINDSCLLDTKITVNDFIVRAVALSIREYPLVNVSWNEGDLRRYNDIDICVAVAIEGGLMTPIIENADKKSLVQLSAEIKYLAKLAKEGRLMPHQFIGGGITVSNLGMFGIDSFSSIINPPQGSILSIGSPKKTPIYDENDNIVRADIISIGYAVDHRVIDGAIAAKFLEILVKYLQEPVTIVL